MKEFLARFIILLSDIIAIAISIVLAYYTRVDLELSSLPTFDTPLIEYLLFYPIFIVPILLFMYEGIYTYRYDFWHESRLILKALIMSMLIIFAYLALSKSIEEYSRLFLLLSLVYMAFIIPMLKRVVKISLYDIGLWRKRAYFLSENELLDFEIRENKYLGYTKSNSKDADTVFIDSRDMTAQKLYEEIDRSIKDYKEVLFIPLLNDFDLTQSRIYELSNIRSNFISLKNRLKSRVRRRIKYIFDYLIALLSLPIVTPILMIIAFFIKRDEPNSPIIFAQERIGEDGKIFVCYKFRTMIPNNEEIFKEYLKANPDEAEYYHRYRKLKNDPRVTKVGKILRNTSLDELPQIFNVLRGEMSIVGPRPYLPEEKSIMDRHYEFITSVKPGITGLWQVSGRNDIDFKERVQTDVWYIRNWNLWLDIVVILKTIKVVLYRKGAY